ncbi:MAG: glycosyltransferase [Prevotellaceae bacterium]|nr:glycosyltransferase [Prevotellaceae bacterium]
MKILHIGQMVGGLDIYIRNSIEYAQHPFDYVIVTGKSDKHKPIIKDGLPIKEYHIRLFRSLNPVNDLLALLSILRIIKIENPNIIHCHSAKGGVLGRIAGWLTHTRTFYTPHAFSFLSTRSQFKKKIFLFIEKLCRLDSFLLACSDSERELGIKAIGYDTCNALVWNNSVPAVKAEPFDSDENHYVCCIGRPSYQKNPLFFVEVAKRVHSQHPELKFYVLGVGYYSPDLEAMKTRISEFGLDNTVILKTWVDHDEAMRLVAGSRLYLTVSLYEGLPLAVIEAMSLGKAIVASNVLGNKDCVVDKFNGRLLPLDSEIFCNAICYLLDNESILEEYGYNSMQLFHQKFNINQRICELDKIYFAKV